MSFLRTDLPSGLSAWGAMETEPTFITIVSSLPPDSLQQRERHVYVRSLTHNEKYLRKWDANTYSKADK